MPLSNVNISMNKNEIDCLNKYMFNAKKYFEFGCGGSTLNINRYYNSNSNKIKTNTNLKQIVVVDSSEEWIEKIKSNIQEENLPVNQFIYIDINADPKNWGRPKDDSKKINWPKYAQTINNFDDIFDTILVDGRFRVSCCLCALSNMNEDSVLMLHDSDREKYKVIYEFFDIIEKVDSLCILKKQSLLDQEKLNKYKEQYKYDCS